MEVRSQSYFYSLAIYCTILRACAYHQIYIVSKVNEPGSWSCQGYLLVWLLQTEMCQSCNLPDNLCIARMSKSVAVWPASLSVARRTQVWSPHLLMFLCGFLLTAPWAGQWILPGPLLKVWMKDLADGLNVDILLVSNGGEKTFSSGVRVGHQLEPLWRDCEGNWGCCEVD